MGVSNLEIVTQGNTMEANQSTASYDTRCPQGKSLLGGGVATFNKDIQILTSTPLGDVPGGRWIVNVRTFNGQPVGVNSGVNVRIVCATVDS